MINDEVELVARAQTGDEAAFETLVHRHADRLHAVVARMVDDPQVAQDVTQETFIRAWKAIAGFRGDAEFSTWLHRIGVNEAKRRSERNRRGVLRGIRSLDAGVIDPPDLSAGPQLRAEQAELRRALERAVRLLALDHRVPLVLRDVEGLSTAEAAQICGLSESAFKSRLHRARLAVRRSVQDYLIEDER